MIARRDASRRCSVALTCLPTYLLVCLPACLLSCPTTYLLSNLPARLPACPPAQVRHGLRKDRAVEQSQHDLEGSVELAAERARMKLQASGRKKKNSRAR